MKKQRILSSLLAVAMTFSLLPSTVGAASGAKVFSDVSKDSWYYKYVDHVAEEGYFGGTSATTFSPDMTMDRAQFAVVLAAVEGVEVDNNVAPFADVPAGTWYSGAVAWAAENGIVAGGDNNKYYPTTPINREQMAVIMNAYINWHNNEQGTEHNENVSVDGFADAKDISSWAVAAVDACRTYGLIAGSDDGNFYPKASATRAQVATVIYNLSFFMLGGGGGGGKDYIYNAINDTLVDISEVLVTTTGLMYDKDTKEVSFGYNIYNDRTNLGGAMITTSGADDRDDGIILKADNKIVKDGDIKTRPQKVTLTVDIGEDTLYSIANYAWDTASAVVYGTMTPNEAKEALKNDSAEIRKQVKGFISDFENATGINLSIEQREEMVESAIAYAKDFGGKVIENFTDDNGKYYTGDITVSVGENEAAKTVINVGETASFSGDKSDAVVALASAIARALHGDLAAKCPDWTPVTDLSIEAVVNVTFSGNTVSGYKTATDKKPYAYPITLALEFNSAEVGSHVHYGYFDGQDNVKLIIPYGAQQKYNTEAAKFVNYVLESEEFTQYVNNKFGVDTDALVNEAVAGLMNSTTGPVYDLKGAVTTLGGDASIVDTAMTRWKNVNYSNLLLFVAQGDGSFNNSNLYTLVGSIADLSAAAVVDKLDEQLGDATIPELREEIAEFEDMIADLEDYLNGRVGSMLTPDQKADVEDQINEYKSLMADAQEALDNLELVMDSTPDTLIANLEELNAGINNAELASVLNKVKALPDGIEAYVCAAICESLNGNDYVDAAYADMTEDVDDMISSEAADARQDYIDDAEAAGDTATLEAIEYAQDIADKLMPLTKFDTLVDHDMSDVIELLEIDMVESKLNALVAQLGDESTVNQVANLIDNLPDDAVVTLAGITVDKADLAEAIETDDVCAYLISILAQNRNLAVSDFFNGEDLTVTAKGRTHTIGLYIHIADGPTVG